MIHSITLICTKITNQKKSTKKNVLSKFVNQHNFYFNYLGFCVWAERERESSVQIATKI